MGGRRGPAPQGKPCNLRTFGASESAVTPIVGTILILGIAVAGLAMVMTWGLPALKQTQAEAEIAGLIHQFENLEELTENVMRSGGIGKANEATISFSEGQIWRSDGTLFVLTAHPFYQGINYDVNDDRFWVKVEPQDGTYAVTVTAGAAVEEFDGYWVQADTVTSATASQLASPPFNAEGVAQFSIDIADIGEGSLRLRVYESTGSGDRIITESWVIPAGAFEYERITPYGVVQIHLEMGSVITTYESGSAIQTQPLVRLEETQRTLLGTDTTTNPSFLGIFAQRYVATEEGVASAGPGGHPIRLSLQENILRISGMSVREVNVQAIGDRGAIWEEFFVDTYQFSETLCPEDDPGCVEDENLIGVVLAMGEKQNPSDQNALVPDPFQLVIMESRIELSLLEAGIRLDG